MTDCVVPTKKKRRMRLSLWTSQINQNLTIGTINHLDSLTWLISEIKPFYEMGARKTIKE